MSFPSELSSSDYEFMARAIRLARNGLYTTMPNPRVGCVLVKDGAVIAEGWHARAGEGHAEVQALADARDRGVEVAGATAYVTLEPCSHTGKTGPCADALIKAGIGRLVYGMKDPNPQVAGRGLTRIAEVGISVDGPILEAEARQLNPGFIKRMECGRPLVRCKLAMSVDGRTAMASGESQWITGPEARSDVQKLRARSCAVVTGVGSILLDDSSLTVRANELGLENAGDIAKRQPLRVVLDSNQRLHAEAKVVQSAAATLVVSTADKANSALPAEIEQLSLSADETGRVNLGALLDELGRRQCNEVLLETGATLAGAFLQAGLIDELIVYMAPKLLGSRGRPLLELPFDTMDQQVPLTINDVRAVGRDWRLTLMPDLDTRP
ncbi:bifunctional diaminohydroxyphosphoribosylaminopyrimidine deaminase/5-amino-6-(5-phosphoribosylamino)uracil reductase RibD [Candidatus Pelagadaptatus aseana]|uniref:bifunctional diaminohydroxyphosphoribosylaminopyrimidine deaminase/5-amino-6-(5-phosphoribosylamino)uracil reductase RibD n=1 Tax=Candidatus Pelagadaptatus aseana TaxID=3120508 RepID=UPI003C6F1597